MGYIRVGFGYPQGEMCWLPGGQGLERGEGIPKGETRGVHRVCTCNVYQCARMTATPTSHPL